jgi:hypothetical protein
MLIKKQRRYTLLYLGRAGSEASDTITLDKVLFLCCFFWITKKNISYYIYDFNLFTDNLFAFLTRKRRLLGGVGL